METFNIVGKIPRDLLAEIVGQLKSELLTDLVKTINDNEPNRYFSAQEICERLGITKPTIHDWKRKGIIKSFKLGSRVYYRMDQIESAMIIS